MAEKETVADFEPLHYANLAVLAEQAGDYEEAAKQWHKASGASLRRDSFLLYGEAAKRCERKASEESE